MKNSTNKKFKLVSFDMDGTLIQNTTADIYYASILGCEDETIKLENELLNGVISNEEYVNSLYKAQKNLSLSLVEEHFTDLPFINNIKESVNLLKSRNIETCIITSSGLHYAEMFKKYYGIDYIFGTKHEILYGGFIGKGIDICTGNNKVNILKFLTNKIGITNIDCVAVGDSFSDIEIFKEVGFSIALNHDNHLDGKADIYIKSDDLLDVIKKII